MINNLREIIAPFFVGPGGQPLSPEEIARRREVADSLLGQATDTSPTAGGSASVLAKAIQGLSYGINTGRANRAAQANNEASQANISAMLGLGGSTGGGGSAFPPAPSAGAIAALTAPTDTASARVAQAHNVGGTGSFGGDLRGGIIETANALGIDPADLATAISYETGGTFDPTKRGPTTQWGQHRGLIQFGEPQAREHGVNWEDPIGSQLGPNGAVASYLRKAGVQPGMGLLDVYSAINAGAPGLYNRSDANNGGAPGTVRDKVERQMAGHRQKALALLGDYQNAGIAANEAMAAGGLEGGLTPDALTSWAEQNYAPGAVTQSPLAPIDVGVAETEEDILAQEALLSGDPAFSLAVEGEQMAPPIAPEPVLGMEPEAMAPAAVPQPSVQAIQALTGAQVNEALPMSGGANNVAPTINAAPSNPMAGLNPAVAQALVNPNASPQERAIAQSLLQQHMAQNQALQAQAQEAAQRAQTLAQRRGLAGQLGVNPDFAGDESIWKAATEASFRDAPSRAAGSYIQNRDGTFTQVPINPTGDIQNYEYYERKEREAGRVPLSPLEHEQALRRSGATNITNTVGGNSGKFIEKSDELAATRLSDYVSEGARATQTMSDMQQLIDLTNVIGTGREAELKAALGPYAEALGIDIANLGEIQAFKSITDRLAPQMRPAGAGSSSDTDVKMFLNSLPNLRNRADGNIIIANTMRGVAENKMQAAEISSRALSGEMTWQEAEKQIRALPNPYENFKNFMKDGSSSTSGGVKWRVK